MCVRAGVCTLHRGFFRIKSGCLPPAQRWPLPARSSGDRTARVRRLSGYVTLDSSRAESLTKAAGIAEWRRKISPPLAGRRGVGSKHGWGEGIAIGGRRAAAFRHRNHHEGFESSVHAHVGRARCVPGSRVPETEARGRSFTQHCIDGQKARVGTGRGAS